VPVADANKLFQHTSTGNRARKSLPANTIQELACLDLQSPSGFTQA